MTKSGILRITNFQKGAMQTILLVAFLISNIAIAQKSTPNDFPELIMTNIPGAPKLDMPTLITGNSGPLTSQGFGLAAPAFWDWDGDGLRDLLIGEFGSGMEYGRYMGNFVRVFLNVGVETQPSFIGNFDYAWPPFELPTNGTPYSVDQFCCIGFTPQFTDLNNDGYPDMLSGQYYGEVISFWGSAKGFLPGEPLRQQGNPRGKKTMASQAYWLYSSASFGDITNDGKQDLILGGRALRISKNIGTSSDPKFANRELLLDTQNRPLKVYEYSEKELKVFSRIEPYVSGDYKLSPVAVDWDEDGVLDLLVTNSYNHEGLSVVDFFRGVKVGIEHRFDPAVPLFVSKSSTKKAFPGSHPFLFVTDWNQDSVKDLIIGVSVVTMNNEFNDMFSWNWEKDMGIPATGKDPGFFTDRTTANVTQFLKDIVIPPGIDVDDLMTMKRQGFVYVMLGNKNKTSFEKNLETEK